MATDEQTELLREMRDLLRIIAEPALAKRDEKLRTALRALVGKSKAKIKAVGLMTGSRKQADVVKESGIDQGALSRFVKDLRKEGLLTGDDKQPMLAIGLPSNFFDASEGE